MPSAVTESKFRKLQQFTADFCPSQFTLYESSKTGMRVVVVDQQGPKVYGYFALATEIHDDSGSPHTLEHLCFMGSKSYRYKGLLDKLATRAYSNTNAWTATDHTAYTLDTAGWEGFAQILPVYLEHVLLPTLTDSGCYTEVFHIDGSGNDAGVVYSEMQGTQNNQAEQMDLKARRILYPESVGFRYETGGLMENLRKLSADRIRAFHKEMYQPKNLCLVLIGEVDHDNMLNILDKFEASIEGDVPHIDDPFERPWTKHGKTPALEKTIVDTIEFSEEDESMGEILIGFLGHDCNDTIADAAMNTLLTYICGSSVSILENTLVEKEQLASAVYYSTDTRPDTTIWFTISGVATKKLAKVEKRFFEVLEDAASKPLNMAYMKDCVDRGARQLKFHCENSGNYFGDSVIYDHLFGTRDGSTLLDLGTIKEYDEISKWSEKQWKDFFCRWIAHAKHVSILGKPSQKLAKKLKQEEEDRVKEQQKRLGEEGLKRLADKLEAAKAENDVPIPSEVLGQFKVPGVDSIHFISTTTGRSGLAKEMGKLENEVQHKLDEDKTDLPLFIHFEHIPTNFVHINVVLNTHSIPVEVRPLLTVYLLNFFDTPITRGGKRLEYEDVVPELERDTINYSIDDGSNIDNAEVIRIRMQVEPSKYDTAIQWLHDLLYNSIFDVSRLQATVAKILADVPEEKRSGNSMLSSVRCMLHFSQKSSLRAQDTLVKAPYLRRISKLLKSDPVSVVSKLEIIRSALTEPTNFRLFIASNLLNGALPTPISSWRNLIESSNSSITTSTLKPLDSPSAALSEAGRNPGSLAYIIPMPTIDSSFLSLTTSGPSSYSDPILPALAVALAYLDAVEGPIWTSVRGTGLAYGAGFTRNIETGRMTFKVYRSPDAYRAYIAAKKTVTELVEGKVELDDFAMEGAVSSIVVGFADEQPTMSSAALVGFINQVVRGISKDWATEFLKKVREVSKEDVKKVLTEVVMKVFEVGKADLLVTCADVMKDGMVERFQGDGWKVEIKKLEDFQDGYGMQGATEDEEMDEDDDEEDDDDEDDEDDEEDEEEEEDSEEDGDEDEQSDNSIVVVNKEDVEMSNA